MENKNDFTKLQIGAKVYDIRLMSYGCMSEIDLEGAEEYKVKVDFSPGVKRWYSSGGYRFTKDAAPTLYHRKPKIEFIPDPPSILKIVLEGYTNHYPSYCKFSAQAIYTSKYIAESICQPGGRTVKATLTYEVEE